MVALSVEAGARPTTASFWTRSHDRTSTSSTCSPEVTDAVRRIRSAP